MPNDLEEILEFTAPMSPERIADVVTFMDGLTGSAFRPTERVALGNIIREFANEKRRATIEERFDAISSEPGFDAERFYNIVQFLTSVLSEDGTYPIRTRRGLCATRDVRVIYLTLAKFGWDIEPRHILEAQKELERRKSECDSYNPRVSKRYKNKWR